MCILMSDMVYGLSYSERLFLDSSLLYEQVAMYRCNASGIVFLNKVMFTLTISQQNTLCVGCVCTAIIEMKYKMNESIINHCAEI